jgi:orotate phosphoribosyltransferase
MGEFSQRKFNDFIIEQGIVGFFREPVKLKSGRLSNWYVNWRNVAEDVYMLERLTDYVLAFVEDLGLGPDCFYGVAEGATKLGVITQYRWAKKQKDYGPGVYTLPMGRGRPKDHGDIKDRFFVGAPKGKTIILEDVTTTGGSLLATVDHLLDAGVKVMAAISLTDRNERGDNGKTIKETVGKRGIPFYAMSNALDLLPEMPRDLLRDISGNMGWRR